MFSATYIKKCVRPQAQEELQYFRAFTTERDEKGFGELKPFSFEKGDCFHCPERMDEDEVKVAERASRTHVYTLNPRESYIIEECSWIPTADQLREGLRNVSFSIGDTSDMNEEQILDKMMRERKKMKWDREKGDWIKI